MDVRRRRLLFFEFTDDYALPFEHIERICVLHGCQIERHRYSGIADLASFLATASPKFGILYVGAHGNEDGVGAGFDNQHFIRWADFADQVCGSPGLHEDTVLYLGCCYGGVLRGSQVLMTRCETINFVAGLPCPFNSSEAVVAFTTFMHWDRKRASAAKIRSAVGTSVGEEFAFHSRYEMDHCISMLLGGYLPDAFLSSEQFDEREKGN